MKKRTVGIFARYDASEQTFCAEYLARYVTNCYRYTKWFVPEAPRPGSRFHGFSHQWDSEVVPWHGKRKETLQSLQTCDTFFFFERNEEILDRLPEGTVTAFVMNPHDRNPESTAFAKRCRYSLVTGSECNRHVTEKAGEIHRTVWPFDSAMQCIPRVNPDFEKRPGLFFPAFGFSLSERQFVMDVAEIVRLCLPDIRAVVGFYDGTVVPKPGMDSRTHDWRLLRYLQMSDWIIDLNTKPQFCLFPAFAGGYGLPWIGYDIAPNTDERNRARRHLIRNITENRHSGNVVPDLETTARQIVTRLGTPFQGDLDRHAGAGAWDNRRAEFLRVTNVILGCKTRRYRCDNKF
jgi:hypothetical protein